MTSNTMGSAVGSRQSAIGNGRLLVDGALDKARNLTIPLASVLGEVGDDRVGGGVALGVVVAGGVR